MSQFKIQSKVPIPTNNPGRAGRYPFGEMKVGDSFVVKGTSKRNTVSALASQYGKRHGLKFRTALVKGGVGVWRIK